MNSMNPTPSDVEKLLMECGRWNISGNMFVAFEHINKGVEIVHSVPTESLALLHPHLPSVAGFIYQDDNLKLDGKCYMAALVITLEHWAQQLPKLTDDGGNQHVLADVVDIEEKEGTFVLRGLHVRLGKFTPDGSDEPITFVRKTLGMHSIFVTPTELENRYPGWSKRLELVEGLELKGRSRMQCLFAQPLSTNRGNLPEFIID